MKRIIKLSLLLLAFLLPATAAAYDFEVDGLYYNINGNEVIVTNADDNWDTPNYSGDVTIPESVTYNGTTYSVTAIGNSAFWGCTSLTSVIIGDLVTTIGDHAFYGCSGLTSISIGNSVTSIGFMAFYGCSGLTCISVSRDNTKYDSRDNCNAIIETSANKLVVGCKSTVIPNTVISIGNAAFESCSSGLTSIDIPNSVTSIGDFAFYGCSDLTSISIGNSVTNISKSVFYNCSGLKSITVASDNTKYDSRDNCNAIIETSANKLEIGCNNSIIPTSVTSIGNSAFSFCSGLARIDIPNSVKLIGDSAFYGCSSLTSVNIGGSVSSVGEYAFFGCSSLTSVNIGDSVTSVGKYAFYGCSSLANVSIGNSVTNIGKCAFYNCRRISNLFYNAVNCAFVGEFAFVYNESYYITVQSLQFGDSVQHIPAGLPSLDMSGKTLIIPNSVRAIDAGAINGSCASVVIGKGVEGISAGTFSSGISVAYATTTDPQPCQPGAFANPQTLYVPSGSKMKYFTSPGWSEFANIIEDEYSPAVAIELDQDNVTLHRGATLQLSATVLPGSVSASSIGWYSTNPNVATVSSNGLVTAQAVGDADIIVWVDHVSDTCHVEVHPTKVESIELSATLLSMSLGDTYTLTAEVTPDNAENKTLEWIIPENDVIATIMTSENHLNIGASGEGTVTITVRATDGSGVSATCVVNVASDIVLATSVELDCESAELTEGETLQLTATVLPEDATDKTVTWASSNEAVATVNENGLVTAVAAGTATIIATTNDGSGLSASCTVTVASPVAPVGDNILVMSDTTVMHGDIIALPVALSNDAALMAFQTDIFLPAGFTIVTDEDDEYIITPSERLSSDHVIMSDNANNGSVRVICYTPNSQPIGGNEGDLFYIHVQVPDDAEGPYTINLRNTLLTTVDYTEISAPDTSAQINVIQFIPGDVNDSRSVTVTDIVIAAQYILDRDPSPFIFEAADMNGDGNVTVTDIMLIAYLINHPTMNAPRRMPALTDNGDRMSGESVSLMAGETRTVSIVLDNEMDYTAFQMDLTLPEGLTASNFRLTDRAGSHAFDMNAIGCNKVRLLCYSPAIEVIDGHSGALLTFDVTATAAIEGDITVDGIELVTADCQTVLLDGFAIGVNAATGVNEVASGKPVARVDYFNVAGQRIDRPESGVTLVVTTYTDGTRTTTKAIK